MKPKCHECDREAVWLVKDLPGIDGYFVPLCEEHFQEIVQMEGEMNLDFDMLDNIDLDDVIREANEALDGEYWKHEPIILADRNSGEGK